jgi:GNAT superfamily N-acetyltransferase
VSAEPYVLRDPRPGDLGWVVQRHGELYAQECGWDWRFEALVARICADFVEHFNAKCERCWIAEREGQNIGCVFLVKYPELPNAAKLRMLLVEPSARGLGLGKRLVDECAKFAREAGYKKIILWTNSSLHTARHIYERAGYRKTHEQPDPLFHPDELAQTWELEL